MRNRTRHSRSSIAGLRLAIDCLPVATREAMLEGVQRYERIIVGAYVDEQGGVCPMLAAHRCGGRTDFLSFAKSWDRFARSRNAPRLHRKMKRAATERELRVLVQQLQDSLAESGGLELDRAIAEHRALLAEGHRRRARLASDAEPRGELRVRRLRLPRRRSLQPLARAHEHDLGHHARG
ncbi:MAG TPA: hypothetical protein VFW29_04780 [Solirubrobacteraceae bacterium]|nr:hypothetical protein [Solirubrobacteraceae bacterium]